MKPKRMHIKMMQVQHTTFLQMINPFSETDSKTVQPDEFLVSCETVDVTST